MWVMPTTQFEEIDSPEIEAVLRWRFEELRVAIFAPELEPLRGVSMASVARAVEAL